MCELLYFFLIAAADLFPFGDTEGDTRVPVVDDGSAPPVTFTTRFPFFASEREVLYVSWIPLTS